MDDLLACPFCGAGTTEIAENGRIWLGMRWSEPSSVSVSHWCSGVEGQPSRRLERVGKDRAAAIAAWNQRAPAPPHEVEGVAHHGPPILTERERDICVAMAKWIDVARSRYGDGWLPSWVDIEKSRLFWRLRSGKQPLKYPPPTAYSCPWYEVVDEADREHWAFELWEGDFLGEYRCSIAQCSYKVIERAVDDNSPSKVTFGPYVFSLRKGPAAHDSRINGWWMQLVGLREAEIR